MRKTEQSLMLLALLVFFVFSFQSARAADKNAADVVALANQARAAENLAPLAINGQLVKAALNKAGDMLAHDYFAHTSPQGVTPWAWFDKSGYDYKYAGENLAMGFVNLADQQQAWMNSTEHRKNILNPNFKDIGVAVVQGKIDGAETMLTVEEFGAPFVVSGSKAPEGDVLSAQAFNGDPIPQLIPGNSLPSVNVGYADVPGRAGGLEAALAIFAIVIVANPIILLVKAFQPILGMIKKRYALPAKKYWKALRMVMRAYNFSIALKRL